MSTAPPRPRSPGEPTIPPATAPAGRRLSAPALVAGHAAATWLSEDGVVERLEPSAAVERARVAPPLVCHAPALARRLRCDPFPALDVLELFAFVRPAAFCTPTPRGLARALALPLPGDPVAGDPGAGDPGAGDPAAGARALLMSAERLLDECAARLAGRDRQAAPLAWVMARAGWRWGPAVLDALGAARDAAHGAAGAARGLAVWERLPDWQELPPPGRPGNDPVTPAEARERLSSLLDVDSEPRPQQADYASAMTRAFQPRESAEAPVLVLAEAGTGVGKTLGYIAPASLWAEKNKGAVWISTYTRNLQHQIDGELDRLHPEPREKAEKVVIRKGRENYLCLLNFEEAVRGLPARPADAVAGAGADVGAGAGADAVAVGLMARWAARSRDGDMVGGDFPGWLPELVGRGRTLGLTDRRGECVYSACAHYGKCFIERGIRRARHARVVVANHALVLVQAARGAGEESAVPGRLIFDEGHHVFEAADSAFCARLTGQETQELRRWLLGSESGGRGAGRLRGLERRIEDLAAADEESHEALNEVLRAARVLPAEGWPRRLAQGAPRGPLEAFLERARVQVFARARGADGPYSLETETRPPGPGLVEAAEALDEALARLAAPLKALAKRLTKRLDEEAAELDGEARRRIEGVCRGLRHRAVEPIAAWRAMLRALGSETTPETSGAFVDWFEVTRIDGRDVDVGAHRHWVDPTRPLAELVLSQTQAAAITSATLTDGSGDAERDWAAAEMRNGAVHLAAPALRVRVPSPFDYAGRTRVLIVGDVRKDRMDQVAAAYRALFLAAGGGGLGLFTAISRLRAVHQRIAEPLERAGIPLYAQHADRMDTATLVDIFRAEEDSCLLGTDAVRDGVDVPGPALRLIVFDRVPWPRPDIAHRARREVFGGRAYDDLLARLRLKQAYGRLIRRADDRGVFVLLDPMMPTRLTTAFPEGVEARRLGLAEAVARTRDFLGRGGAA